MRLVSNRSLATAAMLIAAATTPSLRAERAEPGDRLSVKVELDDEGLVRVESVERTEDEDLSLRGPLTAWDAGAVVFGPIRFELGDAELEDERGRPLARERLREGLKVKVELEPDAAGRLRVTELQLRPEASSSLRLEGPLEAVTADGIRLLGVPLLVDEQTEWKGLEPPAALRRAERLADAKRLVAGAWLSVKGESAPGPKLLAGSAEPSEERERTVRGVLSSYDPEDGRLRIGPVEAAIDELTDHDDENGRDVAPDAFRPGDYVKATLAPAPGGGLRVAELKKRRGFSEKYRLEGPVDAVTPVVTTEARFRMLGVEIVADADTDWEGGLVPPRLIEDDEEARPLENVSLGPLGTLSGEVRLDFTREEDFDLTGQLADDLEELRLRTDLEWTFPATRRVAGMLELRAQSEWIVHAESADDREDPQQEERLRLGESWVLFRDLAGGRLAVQLGRNRWDDRRDWWYQQNLDSLRLFLTLPRARLELSVGRQLLDPSRFLEHATWHHLRLDLDLAKRHRLALILLDRDDSDPDLEERFAPTWYGLTAEGRVRGRLEYWAELAWARGRVGADESASGEAEDLRGFAHDLGLLLHLPGRWEPSLTLVHARGSGDDDPQDGVTKTFRQTGLHDNNTKLGGVTSFRYHGEVLDPELANLEVATLSFAAKPRDWLSFELAWHRYRLVEPAAALVDAGAGEDRRLDLVGRELGEGWDLIVGWERYEHWEAELNLGVFEPGEAFLGEADEAWATGLKLKWVF